MRRWLPLCLWLGLGLGAAAYLVAIYRNPTARLEQIARWTAVLVPPEYAFIGDSLTKGGGLWGWRLGRNPLAAINLAQNGADTAHIAEQARKAAQYRPRRIVVMAGTNDANGPTDPTELRNAWRRLFAATGSIPVMVFLPARSARPFLNNILRDIEPVVRQAAAEAGACLQDINSTIAPNGLLETQYTTDGVHFTDKTYDVWVARLAEAARGCGN